MNNQLGAVTITGFDFYWTYDGTFLSRFSPWWNFVTGVCGKLFLKVKSKFIFSKFYYTK